MKKHLTSAVIASLQPSSVRTPRKSWVALLAAVALAGISPLHAATNTWTAGESPDLNWITGTFGNWSLGSTPAGNDVLFGSVGMTASSSTVSSTVNSDVAINSLTYQYANTANWHVTEITSGNTLSVGGASKVFTVGGYFGSYTTNQTTLTAIRGTGALSITQAGGTVFIGNIRTNAIDPSLTVPKVVLDMHELSTFSANLGTTGIFSVGSASRTNASSFQATLAEVHLAKTNTITTGSLEIGSSLSGANYLLRITNPVPTVFYLGQTNNINVNNVYIASGGTGNNFSATAKMAFDDSVTNSSPVAVFRGTNGSGRIASFDVAARGNNFSGAGGGQIGVADFTGGEVDMLVTNLTIAQNNFTAVSTTSGTFTMEKGTVDATTVMIANGFSTANSLIQGTLNINGGSFIANTLVSGQNPNANATAGTVEGIINVTSNGALTVTNTLEMARSLRNDANNKGDLKSTLNISDTATVEVKSGGIKMGTRGGVSDAAAITATINLTGGSLIVNGNIEEGSAGSTSTINLDGGTLNMKSKNITVDNFNAKSGILENVGQLNSGGDLTKTTSGILRLAGTNTYTGATKVTDGTLLVNGLNTGATGAVTVDSGATLGGTGTIGGDTTLSAGSYLSAGDNSLSTLTFANSLDISAVNDIGNLKFTLGAVGSSDMIASGALTIGSGTLGFDDFNFATITGFGAGAYVLFQSTGITGSLDLGNLTGIIDGWESNLSINGNDIYLNVVPEPSTAVLFGLGISALLFYARRRRKSA